MGKMKQCWDRRRSWEVSVGYSGGAGEQTRQGQSDAEGREKAEAVPAEGRTRTRTLGADACDWEGLKAKGMRDKANRQLECPCSVSS